MLRRFISRPELQISLVFTVAWRILYSAAAAAFVPLLRSNPPGLHSNALTENLPAPHGLYYYLLGIWQRYDTLWYLRIAEHGYDRPMAVIFYPLYPAAIRVVSGIMPAMAAALLISTVADFYFFWGLLKLGKGALSDVGRFHMLCILCVWPTSFILFGGYADALTLALVIWAVVLGRVARWGAATVCGLLAGIARPSGVLIVIPLAIMALRSQKPRSLIVALTPVGLVGYWSWLRWSGRLSVIEAYRRYQGMAMAPPNKTLAETLRLIVHGHDILLAIKLGLVIVVAIVSLRRNVVSLRIEDKAFALAVILQMLMYSGRPLLGAARYLLVVYPAFLAFGVYAERWNMKQFGVYFAALFVLNMAWMWAFVNWAFVV
jgi:hypothetical protein